MQPPQPQDVVERALEFVSEFQGDPRCSLNSLFAEALAGEVSRLRIELQVAREAHAWPDGSVQRERWLMHVLNHIPMSDLAQACIRAKEDTEPHYLMFMEPVGYKPKADFTCWVCGLPTPHPHSHAEIDSARKTLAVFHEHVWKYLCVAQRRSVGVPSETAEEPR